MLILSWGFSLAFFLLFLLSLYARNWLPSIFVLIISVLLLPPARAWLSDTLGIPLPVWPRLLLIPALLVMFIFLTFKGMGNKFSIYKNPEIESRLMALYDARIREWPVPYESRFIDTDYGKVHVIISGPEDAPPLVLLHASAMAGWSWLYNIEGLNARYRTYAIDTIGDAGRSVLADIKKYPSDGASLANLYQDILNKLGVVKACFIGGSQGGFIATNIALYQPEFVDKLILCGPMGYSGTNSSVLRILVTTMFPVKPLQESSFSWAFGKDSKVREAVGEWFRLILKGVISRQARPRPFSTGQLRSLKAPVLLLLGKRDGLVGDPEKAARTIQGIPGFRVKILDTGHLISCEKPAEFNRLVLDFITEPSN